MGPSSSPMLFAAVAAVATVLTLAMPVLSPDMLDKRMKAVALEREKIRQRERERLARGEKEKVSLRQSPKQYMATVVERFNLTKWLGQEAGAREAGAGRLSRPGALCRLPVLPHGDAGRHVRRVAVLPVRRARDRTSRRWSRSASASAPPISACRLPYLFLKNRITKRQLSIKRAFPGRARPAADLRRVRHVDRGGVPQGQRRRSARSRSRWPRS